jgi:hypothetical protein
VPGDVIPGRLYPHIITPATKKHTSLTRQRREDAVKLLSMLMRWHHGEKKVWSVVQVPSVADENRRQLHRDLLELKGERTQHGIRIKGLLAGFGIVALARKLQVAGGRQGEGAGQPRGARPNGRGRRQRRPAESARRREPERQGEACGVRAGLEVRHEIRKIRDGT